MSDHEPRIFADQSLRGARFIESDLSDVVIRGSEISGMDIDAPWLPFGKPLVVNGVDVVAYVEGELDRRFPGRALWRTASTPEELREAWRAAVTAWDAAVERADGLPEGAVDERVDGEWSFAETVRHLVHATDLWVGHSVLGHETESFHPLGLSHGTAGAAPAPYVEVLAARAEKVAMVDELIESTTDTSLDEPRANPHDPERQESVRHCVKVVIEESWEHLRFALRDLDVLAARA